MSVPRAALALFPHAVCAISRRQRRLAFGGDRETDRLPLHAGQGDDRADVLCVIAVHSNDASPVGVAQIVMQQVPKSAGSAWHHLLRRGAKELLRQVGVLPIFYLTARNISRDTMFLALHSYRQLESQARSMPASIRPRRAKALPRTDAAKATRDPAIEGLRDSPNHSLQKCQFSLLSRFPNPLL